MLSLFPKIGQHEQHPLSRMVFILLWFGCFSVFDWTHFSCSPGLLKSGSEFIWITSQCGLRSVQNSCSLSSQHLFSGHLASYADCAPSVCYARLDRRTSLHFLVQYHSLAKLTEAHMAASVDSYQLAWAHPCRELPCSVWMEALLASFWYSDSCIGHWRTESGMRAYFMAVSYVSWLKAWS